MLAMAFIGWQGLWPLCVGPFLKRRSQRHAGEPWLIGRAYRAGLQGGLTGRAYRAGFVREEVFELERAVGFVHYHEHVFLG
jgi:hypothetical protein